MDCMRRHSIIDRRARIRDILAPRRFSDSREPPEPSARRRSLPLAGCRRQVGAGRRSSPVPPTSASSRSITSSRSSATARRTSSAAARSIASPSSTSTAACARMGGRRGRQGGVGLRLDDARQRVGVSRRRAGRRPRRDEGAGRRAAAGDGGVRRARPSDRSLPRARARVPPRRRGGLVEPARSPSPIPKLCTLVVASAFDAGDSRRLRQGVRREQSTQPTARRSWRTTCRTISGRSSRASTSIATSRPRRARRRRCFIRSARAIRSRRPTSGRRSTMGCRRRSRSGFRATA